MARSAIDRAILALGCLKDNYPSVDLHLGFGKIEIVFRDGVPAEIAITHDFKKGKEFDIRMTFDDDGRS